MPHNVKPNILIIDDTEVNRYIVSRTLERAGYSVISGVCGEDALRLVRTHQPDLVVLDVKLPDISGLEVCRQLKANPATAPIPVLHLSATHVLSEDRVAGLDSGADAYLTQPVDSRELLATVNSLLRARRAEDALRRIQWLLHRSVSPEAASEIPAQSYGDLSQLNTHRLLLDSVGAEVLRQIAGEYLDLLDTSTAIYEINGDYALSLVSSGWCRFMDESSRKLCGIGDTRQALRCGQWHCHESSWHEASQTAIQQRKPVDIECRGGIRIYALPILAGDEVVGCINVGYGDPPRHPQKLAELAQRYGVTVEQLKTQADAYESRPPFIVDVAKKRLHTAARLIGEIVERKRAERQLRHAKEAAEAANRAKDHFLAVLSHELRTPLTAVLPALEALTPHLDANSEPAEYLEMAQRNVEMEVKLIDDLLDVTRIARGKIELDRKPIELCTILRRAAEVCAADIDARQLRFNLQIDDSPHMVNADPARLQQVFWNLIKNAIKFTPPGGKIHVRCWREDGHAVVQVTDSGAGINPDALQRIFNAFEQADRLVTRTFGGLGLGLTICKALVELHGGAILAHSAGQGQGATFTVRLPILSAISGPLSPTPGVGQPTANDAPATSKPLKILLVEDHTDTARILSRLLSLAGNQVKHAPDVASALRLASAESFDLLISDLGLPDGTGHDLLRQLAAQGKSLKAIALSGYGMAADVEKSRDAGFSEHLTKPINFDAVEAAVQRVTTPLASPANH